MNIDTVMYVVKRVSEMILVAAAPLFATLILARMAVFCWQTIPNPGGQQIVAIGALALMSVFSLMVGIILILMLNRRQNHHR